MTQASVFKSNRSQAVRIPKALAFPDNITRVDVVPVGNGLLITPAGQSWDHWFDGESVSDDFMMQREQPADQEREGL